MIRGKLSVFVSAVIFCALAVILFSVAVGAQAPPPKDVYAVKFLCGNFPGNPNASVEGPVKPGNYLTAINVHNPNNISLTFRKKAILLFQADAPLLPPETPMKPGEFKTVTLPPNWGLEIDCRDIRTVLLPGPPPPIFIKGWVVIEVPGGQGGQVNPLPLDVTAVYTSHGFVQDAGGALVPEGFAEDVESILPRRVQ